MYYIDRTIKLLNSKVIQISSFTNIVVFFSNFMSLPPVLALNIKHFS